MKEIDDIVSHLETLNYIEFKIEIQLMQLDSEKDTAVCSKLEKVCIITLLLLKI